MGKKDRIIVMLTSSYNGRFSDMLNIDLHD